MTGNPYVGPRPIGGVDHPKEKIYGRTREIADLMDLLIAERIVLLYSPSGAGKTSLLQAGLAPKLGARRFHVRPMARVNAEPPPELNFDPAKGNRYTLSTLLSLGKEAGANRPAAQDLARMTLSEYLGDQPNGEVLIFDQFEEVLTVDPVDVAAKTEFFRQLGDALGNRGRWAVFAMREDYLAGLDQYLDLVPTRLSNTYRLDLLRRERAIEAIQGPALPVDFTLDAAQVLAENLSKIRVPSEDGRNQEQPGLYVEPVQLQVVCHRIWDGLAEGTQKVEAEQVGGVSTVDEALGAYYDDKVREAAETSRVNERKIRYWFGHALITRQKTRGQVSETDDAMAEVKGALGSLGAAYLIRKETRLGTTYYELAHDRLLRPVLDSNARRASDLEKRADLWKDGRPDSLLLSGNELAKVTAEERGQATEIEREYLARSEARQRVRRRVAMLAVLVMLSLVASVVLLWFNYKSRRALEQETQALQQETRVARSGELQTNAVARHEGRIDLASLLAVEAWNQAPNSGSARFTMFTVVLSNPLATVMLHHDTVVRSIAFSPDDTLAAGCSDGTIWLWNIEKRTHETFGAHTGAVLSLAYNRDGLLASGGADGEVRLWDASHKRLAGPEHVHKGRVNALAFDPGGAVLASGGEDGIIRIWDVTNRGFAPASHQAASVELGEETTSIGINLETREILAASQTENVSLLDLAGNSLSFGTGAVQEWRNVAAVGISNSGQKVVVRAENSVEVWAKGDRSETFTEYATPDHPWRSGATIDPTNRFLAGSGQDGAIQVFQLGKKTPFMDVMGPERTTVAMAFNHDGMVLATLAQSDRSVWIWKVSSMPEVPVQPASGKIALSGAMPGTRLSRNLLAVSDTTGKISLRDAGTQKELGAIPASDGILQDFALSFDSTLLAKTFMDLNTDDQHNELLVYSLRDLSHPAEISMPKTANPQSVAFSPVRNLLAVGGTSLVGLSGVLPQSVDSHIWDFSDPSKPRLAATLPQMDAEQAAFSPDGKILATNSYMVSLWDVPDLPAGAKAIDLSPRAVLEGTRFRPQAMLFSPDGALLVTLDNNEEGKQPDQYRIRLWDPVQGIPFSDPLFLVGPVELIGFQKDGRALLMKIRGQFETLRMDAETWAKQLCARANRNLSLQEWKLYVGKDACYQRTCPLLPDGEGVKAADKCK